MSEKMTSSKTEDRAVVHETTAHNLVVVGSSAGGIEALGVLVGSLPQDFPAPLVLAQHLDPRRPSHLATILERRSKLPIVTVMEPTRLERGKVYVVPSNQHVVIHDGGVQLEGDHGNRPKPSVDLLLSSAAQSYGDRLFAVILTGSGTDGSSGAMDVKAAGGTVIIQNPATAAHPSMPQALPPSVVDHIEELPRIGSLLTTLLKPVPLTDATSEDAFSQIIQHVGHHSSIDFRHYKPSTILRRISRRMAIRHLSSLVEYRDYLRTNPDEVTDLVKSLLIKVTEFFRDREAYDRLRRSVFPAIIESGRERGNVIRLWSAGCATGEEAYSLAFLAAEILGSELPHWNVKVFATDLDEWAIAYARRGLYPNSVMKDLPAEYRGRFFDPFDGGARVSRAIRQMVIFGQQDLSRGVPFPRIDLTVCRNLLIYFKPDLQRQVLDLFAYSLHQTRGYLFLGKAETARPSTAGFEVVDKKWRIYRCSADPRSMPWRPPLALVAAPEGQARRFVESAASEAEGEPAYVRRLNEVLLRFLGVGVILIDASYRILTMNAMARRILGVRDGRTDQDFLHAARDLPYGELRNAIDRVLRERAMVTMAEVPIEVKPGDPRWVTLTLGPSHADGSALDNVLITVQDATEVALLKQRTASMERDHRDIEEQIGASNRKLSEINKELQDANEELQASNEEMMLTQEELQATNEEFEATNEEMQATNEELETNNEEMQATNEELETTNEELSARSSELKELNEILTIERLRLTQMVELAPFDVVVISGPTMTIESLNMIPGRTGTGLVKGASLKESAPPEMQPVVQGVQEVYRSGQPWKSEKLAMNMATAEGVAERTLEFTVIPHRNPQGQVIGAVLYGLDVTEAQGREQREQLERYQVMIEHAHQVALALFDAGSAKLIYASSPFERLVLPRVASAVEKNQEPITRIIGRRWQDLGMLDPKQARAAFEEVVAGREHKRLPRVAMEIAGAETIWDCTLIPVAEPQQNAIRHVLVSLVDVTELLHE